MQESVERLCQPAVAAALHRSLSVLAVRGGERLLLMLPPPQMPPKRDAYRIHGHGIVRGRSCT